MARGRFVAYPIEGETEEKRAAREIRVNGYLDNLDRIAGLTRPDLGEPLVASGAPNPLGDPRKPEDRHGPR